MQRINNFAKFAECETILNIKTMKKTRCVLKLWLCLSAFWFTEVAPATASCAMPVDELVVSGIVKDKVSRKKLENVNVSLIGTGIGTVTNADGFFSLKIPDGKLKDGLKFSHLYYRSSRLSADDARKNPDDIVIWMTPSSNLLNEVVVYGGDGRQIVEQALAKIPVNYPREADLLKVFYRETVQKRHRYTGVSEAMMSAYKTAYARQNIDNDRVKILKGRRLMSQKMSDTLAVKVAGGPDLSLLADFVKNGDMLFDAGTMDYYAFKNDHVVMQDNRMQYVISFSPRVIMPYALFVGKLFIDCESLTFTRAEFSLDMSDRDKAIEAILFRKPAGLRFRPKNLDFLITYRQHGESTVLNYVSNIIRFKCDWKRKLFSANYTVTTEMVVVDRDTHPAENIKLKDSFRPKQVFYDMVDEYWDEDYWKDYNIIEPTESLEDGVKNLWKHNKSIREKK